MCTCLGFTPGASAAPLLLDENFSYAAATLLTANGWAAHSGAGTNDIPVTAAGLSYSGYPSSGMGNAASMLTSGEDVHRTYTPQTSGSVYYAFMVNVSAAHTTGDYFTHFGTNVWSTTFPGRVFCRSTTGSAGVEDSDEPSTGVGGVGLRQGTATQAPTLWIDGLRIGTAWADVVCPAPGACCAPAGTCTVTTQANCADPDTWQGAATTCTPNLCPQPTGSCCYPNGTCAVNLAADCTGTWTMFGACVPNDCPQPGSCCAADGSCSVKIAANCTGLWTAGLTCEPNTCPKPTGACCNSYGRCTVTQAADCTGPWTMFGTCADGDCTLPTGACCDPDGSCTVTLHDDCTDPWMLNGGCEPSLCITSGNDDTELVSVLGVRASPNPFTGSVALRIAGPKAIAARVVIFDATGRLVRTAWNGMLNGRAFTVSWDGRDDSGCAAPAGIYLVRLVTGAGTHQTKRLVLLR